MIAPALAFTACCMQLAMLAGLDLPSQTSTAMPAGSSAPFSAPATAWKIGTW